MRGQKTKLKWIITKILSTLKVKVLMQMKQLPKTQAQGVSLSNNFLKMTSTVYEDVSTSTIYVDQQDHAGLDLVHHHVVEGECLISSLVKDMEPTYPRHWPKHKNPVMLIVTGWAPKGLRSHWMEWTMV